MKTTEQQAQQPTLSTPETRAAEAEQITGFRIMRQTEAAPGWWGMAVEIGDTRSATVAYDFCTEQNKVSMDPNRDRRAEYYSEPIYSEMAAPKHIPAWRDLTSADAVADCPTHRAQHEEFDAHYGEGTTFRGRSRQLDLYPSRRTTAVSA